MIALYTDLIKFKDNKYYCSCKCGSEIASKHKSILIRVLKKGSCKKCFKFEKSKSTSDLYKNENDKWCKKCSSCGKEQCYTRKSHAQNSINADYKCKKCSNSSKNKHIGDFQRVFNKYKKQAISRNIFWNLTVEDLKNIYTGKCELSNQNISISYKNTTASLDRIDSKKDYTKDNIQWLHKDINMLKNKYEQSYFIQMCKLVANKW